MKDEDKIIKMLCKDERVIKLDISKEAAHELFRALGFYINEFGGMCDQTNDCSGGYDVGKEIITNDYHCLSRFDCDDCGPIILSTTLREYVSSEWERLLWFYEKELDKK